MRDREGDFFVLFLSYVADHSDGIMVSFEAIYCGWSYLCLNRPKGDIFSWDTACFISNVADRPVFVPLSF